jgi:hypothetical protein
MSPLQEFFIATHASIEFKKGGGEALHFIEHGSYKDVVDLIRCICLAEKPANLRFTAYLPGADLLMGFLTVLLTKSPESILEIQSYGLSFLERLEPNPLTDRETTGQSIFARLTDTNRPLKDALWLHYNARSGLNTLIFNDQKLGYSSHEEGYHTDLILKIMDAMEDDLDEQAVVEYLKSCFMTSSLEINWGVLLHPNATPRIQSWILDHQRASNLMTDSPSISATLKTAYARPYAALAHLTKTGIHFDALAAMDRIAHALDVPSADLPKLGWLLSPDSVALESFYKNLSEPERDEMLMFGLRNKLPLPGSYVPGVSETKKAMLETSFLMLAHPGLPESFLKAAIDLEIRQRHVPEHSWWLPVIINANPEYFFEKVRELNTWDTFALMGKASRSLAAYTTKPSRCTATFQHADATIYIGNQSAANPTGVLIRPQGRLFNLELFFEVARATLERSLAQGVSQEKEKPGGEKPKSRKALLKIYLEAMKPQDCLQLVSHDLLDEAGVQVALGLKSVKPLLPEMDFSKAVIEKMSQGQRAWMLEKDLGL